MKKDTDYQKEQLKAIQNFYNEVNQRTDSRFSMSDVIIAWFTEGHAEVFRRKNLRNKMLAVS
jgi:regulator of sigma D